MSGLKTYLFIVPFLLTGLWATADVCVKTPSVEEARLEADIIFSGKVISHRDIERGELKHAISGMVVWDFTVGQIWKGNIETRFQVLTHEYQFFPFKDGEHYVVFAKQDTKFPEYYRVDICTRTKEAHYAVLERFKLGPALVLDQSLQLSEVTQSEVDTFSLAGTRYKIDARPDSAKK